MGGCYSIERELRMGLEEFHFLRPQLLLLVLPAALALYLIWRRRLSGSTWFNVIDSELLPHLLEGEQTAKERWPITLAGVAALITILALAGPAWQRLPQPVSQTQDALLILLDLSLSMRAGDIAPSRIERAHLKIRDVLRERKEGLTALIAYAGDAHTVAPFTDDARTIESMLPALKPEIMPKLGSRPDLAVALGQQLLQDANLNNARVLMVTDDIRAGQIDAMQSGLGSTLELAVMSVGSKDGSPIPLPQGGFLKDNAGEIIVAKVDVGRIRGAAGELGARFAELSSDSSDIEKLLPERRAQAKDLKETEREFDVWQDEGATLLLLLLPLTLFAFRRGLILPLVLITVLPSTADAAEPAQMWRNLWKTPDQQASEALQSGDAETAQQLFENTEWQASAAYRAGDYEQAAELFSEQNAYNHGNALARAGKLDEAIAAYDQALQENPNDEDATFNKQLLEELKKQQQQQEQDQQENSDQSEQDKQDQQQNQDQQNQNQNDSKDQQSQNSDQQNQEQQNQEQSESESEQKDSETEQPPEEQEKSPEQQQAEAEQDKEQEQQSEAQMAEAEQSKSDAEREQELQQWLRKVPDDPGGLLRNKFRYQYEQNRRRREHYDKDGQLY
ncbi:MAG: VWA domain-containing protein [Pseudomonadales bacterium]